MQIDEFLIRLGVDSDTQGLAEFMGGLRKVSALATVTVGAVAGLTAGVTAFFGAALDGLDSLRNLAEDTGTELAYIQRLGYAAEVSGSSVEAASASVKGLAKTIGEAASGLGRGAQTFQKLGLSAKNADGSVKGVSQVLGELQAKMQGLSQAERLSMLSKLGIDPSMVKTLSTTSEEMRALFEEAEKLGLVTADGAQAAGAFKDTVSQTSMAIGALKTNIAIGLAPQLTELVGDFRDWIIANRELIRGGLTKAVDWILAVFRAISNFLRAIDQVVSATLGWKQALIALVAVLALVKRASIAAFLTNPVFLIAAAVAGLILLVDDLITYLRGGKSAFDWSFATKELIALSKWVERVKTAVIAFWAAWGDTILEGLGGLWSAFKGFLKWLGNAVAGVFALMTGDWEGYVKYGAAAMDGLLQAILGVWDAIYAGAKVLFGLLGVDLDAIGKSFSAAWDGLAEGFDAAMSTVRALWDRAMGVIMAGVEKVRGVLNWIGEKLGISGGGVVKVAHETSAAAGQAMQTAVSAQAPVSPVLAAAGAGSRQISATTQMHNQINITTNDPKAAADLAIRAMKDQQRAAATNMYGALVL